MSVTRRSSLIGTTSTRTPAGPARTALSRSFTQMHSGGPAGPARTELLGQADVAVRRRVGILEHVRFELRLRQRAHTGEVPLHPLLQYRQVLRAEHLRRVPAQMWAGPGADVGSSGADCGRYRELHLLRKVVRAVEVDQRAAHIEAGPGLRSASRIHPLTEPHAADVADGIGRVACRLGVGRCACLPRGVVAQRLEVPGAELVERVQLA